VFVITAYDLTGKPLAACKKRMSEEAAMKNNQLPEGWDESRVKRVIAHYDEQSPEEALAEDEAGVAPAETVMSVPHDLVSRVREMIAKHHG